MYVREKWREKKTTPKCLEKKVCKHASMQFDGIVSGAQYCWRHTQPKSQYGELNKTGTTHFGKSNGIVHHLHQRYDTKFEK